MRRSVHPDFDWRQRIPMKGERFQAVLKQDLRVGEEFVQSDLKFPDIRIHARDKDWARRAIAIRRSRAG